MPFVTTTVDQILSDIILAIDPILSLTIDPNKEYIAQLLYLWDQVDPTDGGLQCCLAINGTGATISQIGSFGATQPTQGSAQPFYFNNVSGSQLVIVTGVIITAGVPTIVSAYRAQARASANPTNIRIGSILQIGQVGQPFIPSNASMFLP